MRRSLIFLMILFGLLAGCSQDQAETPTKAVHPSGKTPQPSTFVDNAEKVFDRVNSVLSGYRAYRGQAPQTLAELDQNDYMFDSRYLADIVPTDSQLYLELLPELDRSRLWLETAGERQIASRELAETQVATLDKAALEKEKTRWQKIATVGRLTQVKR